MQNKRIYLWSVFGVFLLASLGVSRVYKVDVTLYSIGDDDFYWSYGRRAVYEQNFDFRQEPLRTFREYPQVVNFASPFPGFLWTPAVLLGRVLGPVIQHFPKVEKEPAQNGYSTYHRLLVSAFSACLTLMGLLFIYKTLERWFSSQAAFWGVLATFLASPLPYFTFRRPLMSHSAEIFSLGGFVWISSWAVSSPSLRAPLLAGLSMALAVGVRYTNVFVVGGWLLGLWVLGMRPASHRFRWVLVFLLGVLIPVLLQLYIWKSVQGVWIPSGGVYSLRTADVLGHFMIDKSTIGHLGRVLVGPGWGLLWLETPLLFALWSTFRAKNMEGKFLRCLFLGCIPLLFIAANFGSQGGSYGYRYLLAKEIWMAFGIAAFFEIYSDRRYKYLLAASLIFPLLALILFESGPDDLTLHLTTVDWVNDQYAWNALKHLLQTPQQLLYAFAGTPVAHGLIWLLWKTVGLSFLPDPIQAKVLVRLESTSIRETFWYFGWIWLFALSLFGCCRMVLSKNEPPRSADRLV